MRRLPPGLHVQNRYVQWGTGLYDFDNDGAEDLFYVTGHVYPEESSAAPGLEGQYPHRGPRILFRNGGSGRFDDVSASGGSGLTTPHSSRGAAFGDVDNDGDIDVLVMNMNESPSLLRNDTPVGNAWLDVVLEGRTSNRAAIGATVIVTASGRKHARVCSSQSSYYSHDDVRLHFGLGTAARVDEIEVRWPNGGVQLVKDVAVRRLVRVAEDVHRRDNGRARRHRAKDREEREGRDNLERLRRFASLSMNSSSCHQHESGDLSMQMGL